MTRFCPGLYPPGTATRPDPPVMPVWALEVRCCWRAGHLPVLGEFQYGTRKENSKWSLL